MWKRNVFAFNDYLNNKWPFKIIIKNHLQVIKIVHPYGIDSIA